eukprot:gene166-39_t
MASVVDGVAQAAAAAAATAKSAVPAKEDNLMYDLPDLACFDITSFPKGADLAAVSRDNTQLLVNKLFTALPQEKTDTGIVGILRNHLEAPKSTFRVPREKPVPTEKAMTRWERFAQEKGIKKKKRSRLVWDEITKDWVPRWGYKSIKQIEDKATPVIDVKEG